MSKSQINFRLPDSLIAALKDPRGGKNSTGVSQRRRRNLVWGWTSYRIATCDTTGMGRSRADTEGNRQLETAVVMAVCVCLPTHRWNVLVALAQSEYLSIHSSAARLCTAFRDWKIQASHFTPGSGWMAKSVSNYKCQKGFTWFFYLLTLQNCSPPNVCGLWWTSR